MKSLCSHVVENFGKALDGVAYVQTFKALRLRYEQHQDKEKERSRVALDRCVSRDNNDTPHSTKLTVTETFFDDFSVCNLL